MSNMLSARSKQVRRDAIDISLKNGGYHYGGSFSCAEILVNLFDTIMKEGDRFILSKGHGCWVYYVLLRELGFNPTLEGHPHYEPENGVWCTAGSMGHGLPVGIGQALARKLRGDDSKVFVLMGDGECQEGTTWESILIASRLKLDNLVAIVDCNEIQGSGWCDDIMPAIPALVGAATHAGWQVVEIDGHNDDLIKVDYELQDKPILVIADTVKGKGVSFMEGQPKWHSNWLGGDLLKQALEELA
jgi:transketolase